MPSIDLQSQVSATILVGKMIDRALQILCKEPHECFRLGSHMTAVATTSLLSQPLHRQVGVADYSSASFLQNMHVTLIGDSPDRNVCSKEVRVLKFHIARGKQELMPGMKTHKPRSNDLSISVKLWR